MKKRHLVVPILVAGMLIGCTAQPQDTTSTTDTTDSTEISEEATTEENNSEKQGGREEFTPTKTVEELPTIEEDGITVHYSEGFKEKAEEQLARIKAMKEFYKEQKDIDIVTTVNVLDEEDKNAIAGQGIPYGMPFVIPASADKENEIFLPATQEGCIIDATLIYKDMLTDTTLKLFKEAGFEDPEDAIRIYPDLIGLHEVGHASTFEAFGDEVKDYPRWFNEFMSTYYSYSFMMQNEPELAKVWIGNAYISYLDGTSPEYTDFKDFEKLGPAGMTQANYDWYQKKMNLVIAKLYDEMGLDFHDKAIEMLTADSYDTDEILEVLNTITPLFQEMYVNN